MFVICNYFKPINLIGYMNYNVHLIISSTANAKEAATVMMIRMKTMFQEKNTILKGTEWTKTVL